MKGYEDLRIAPEVELALRKRAIRAEKSRKVLVHVLET
jgi:hypothetical protein